MTSLEHLVTLRRVWETITAQPSITLKGVQRHCRLTNEAVRQHVGLLISAGYIDIRSTASRCFCRLLSHHGRYRNETIPTPCTPAVNAHQYHDPDA